MSQDQGESSHVVTSAVTSQPLLVAVYFATYLLQSKQKIKYFHLVEPDDGGLHLHGPPRRPGVRGRAGGGEEGRQRWIAPHVAKIMGFRPSNIILIHQGSNQEEDEQENNQT